LYFFLRSLLASLEKNKTSPFAVKNTITGIFHPHALKGEDSKKKSRKGEGFDEDRKKI